MEVAELSQMLQQYNQLGGIRTRIYRPPDTLLSKQIITRNISQRSIEANYHF